VSAGTRPRAARRRGTEHRLALDVEVWVATASADGDPYLVPLSFDWEGETLLVATPTASPTGRNLAVTRAARLALGHTRDVSMIDGQVNVVEIDALAEQRAEHFAQRSGFPVCHGFTRAGLFVSTLQQVEHLGPVFGVSGISALRKERHVRTNGVGIELLIERALRITFTHGPVLAIWADDQQLDKLEKLCAPAFCTIPWSRADIDDWKLNFNPVNLRTGDPAGSGDTVTSKGVVEALKSLTSRVNLSSGLGHPSDKAAAVQMFKVLRAGGELFDPDQVRAWAARNGWRADHARQLGVLAQTISGGRSVRVAQQRAWRDDILAIWRNDASES
jgi:hypothetical protein